jgi:hypothetical protein
MKSYLQQLENNEAILLMYLADELPPDDRQEVEQMLASDPSLRAELEILRQTQELAFDALRSLDGMTRPVMMPMAAQRRVGDLIRRWINIHYKPADELVSGNRQLPWRRIGVAIAASLMIGFYIWTVYNQKLGPEGVPSNQSAFNGPNDPFGSDNELPTLPQHRDLTSEEKLALLSIPLDDSGTEESNLHVAEVASVTPADGDYSSDGGRTIDNHAGDSNTSNVGQP